jgi:Tfp pilus assembly protein PilW
MNMNLSSRSAGFQPAVSRISNPQVQAMTLSELMVTIAIGSLVLIVVAMLFTTSARSFAAIGSYVDMDSNSRNALDHMTLEIRRAGELKEFSATHLKFAAQGQTNSFLVYDYDPASASLTEWKTGNTTTNTLLTECDQLTFSLYNSSFAPTAVLSKSKGISVNWKCSRTMLGRKSTTEDVQQALIVMRN